VEIKKMNLTGKAIITDEDPEFNVYHLLQDYANANPEFDCKFLNSIEKMIERDGKISGNQLNVLIKQFNKLNLGSNE